MIQNLYPTHKKVFYVKNYLSFDSNLIDLKIIDKLIFENESVLTTVSMMSNIDEDK